MGFGFVGSFGWVGFVRVGLIAGFGFENPPLPGAIFGFGLGGCGLNFCGFWGYFGWIGLGLLVWVSMGLMFTGRVI